MTNPDEKETPKTLLQEIFGNSEILVSRPPEMTKEEYRYMKNLQDKLIKKLQYKQPNRKLLGLMTPHKPLLKSSKGYIKPITQRKAS
jgi:hypothetical protein